VREEEERGRGEGGEGGKRVKVAAGIEGHGLLQATGRAREGL